MHAHIALTYSFAHGIRADHATSTWFYGEHASNVAADLSALQYIDGGGYAIRSVLLSGLTYADFET